MALAIQKFSCESSIEQSAQLDFRNEQNMRVMGEFLLIWKQPVNLL